MAHRLRSSVTRERLPLLLYMRFGHQVQMHVQLGEGQGLDREPDGRDYISTLALECHRIPQLEDDTEMPAVYWYI